MTERERVCALAATQKQGCVCMGRLGWDSACHPRSPVLANQARGWDRPASEDTHAHRHTHTQAVTQIHGDRAEQGSTTENAPAVDPLALVPQPLAKGSRTRCPFPSSSRKHAFVGSLWSTHTNTHKRALKESGRSAKDVKASCPVPSRGERRQKGG